MHIGIFQNGDFKHKCEKGILQEIRTRCVCRIVLVDMSSVKDSSLFFLGFSLHSPIDPTQAALS